MSAEGATALPARRTAGMSAPASGSDGGGSDGGGNPSPVGAPPPASSPPPVARTETELRLEAQLAAAREEQGAAEAELKRVLGAQGALLDRVRALDEAQRSSDATIEARIRAAHDAVEAAHERETALQKELKDANAALAEAKRNGGSDSGGGGGGNSGVDGGDGAAVAAARAETEKYKARLAEVSAKEAAHTARIGELEAAVGSAIELTRSNAAQMSEALARRDQRTQQLEKLLLQAEGEREKAVELCQLLQAQIDGRQGASVPIEADGESEKVDGDGEEAAQEGGAEAQTGRDVSLDGGLSSEDAAELLETLAQSERERERAIGLAEDLHAQLSVHQERLEQSEAARGAALELCERTSAQLREVRESVAGGAGSDDDERGAALEACEQLTEQLRAQVARAEAAEARLAVIEEARAGGEGGSSGAAAAALASSEALLIAERREHSSAVNALVGKLESAVGVVNMLQDKLEETEETQARFGEERKEHFEQVQDLASKMQRAVEIVAVLEDRAEAAEARVAQLEAAGAADAVGTPQQLPSDDVSAELMALLEAERAEHAGTVAGMADKMGRAVEAMRMLSEQVERAEAAEARAEAAEARADAVKTSVGVNAHARAHAREAADLLDAERRLHAQRVSELAAKVAQGTAEPHGLSPATVPAEATAPMPARPRAPTLSTRTQAVEADAASYYTGATDSVAQKPARSRSRAHVHRTARPSTVPASGADAVGSASTRAQPLRMRAVHAEARVPSYMAPTISWIEGRRLPAHVYARASARTRARSNTRAPARAGVGYVTAPALAPPNPVVQRIVYDARPHGDFDPVGRAVAC